MTLLYPKLLWLNGELHRNKSVVLENGQICAIQQADRTETPDSRPYLLMPACTDLQVNGAGGAMLNSRPDAEGVKTIVTALQALGTGWVMPTLISTNLQKMQKTADAILDVWGMPGLLGVHFEGPYTNVVRKGAHKAEELRPFDPESMEIFHKLRRHDVPVMLTLAPECVPADIIAALTQIGVVVSAGHTDATLEQTQSALASGLNCFTHLFNAMPQMTSRAPGIIAAAINSSAYCGVIMDGIHVDWSMLQLATAARPEKGRMFIVSDCMATVGGPDFFELDGQTISVSENKLVNAAGSLAGAHIDMVASMRNAVEYVGLPLAEAVAMCTDIPHHVMGLAPPQIQVGRKLHEILALDDDLKRLDLSFLPD